MSLCYENDLWTKGDHTVTVVTDTPSPNQFPAIGMEVEALLDLFHGPGQTGWPGIWGLKQIRVTGFWQRIVTRPGKSLHSYWKWP